jgi:ABC-type branched-subunit amino acid transport system ATPase component
MLDEAVTGMNETEKANMVARMRMLRESGITILLVEHDMKTIMTICDKITVLNFGKKISEGAAEEVSKNKDVIEAYLGAEL